MSGVGNENSITVCLVEDDAEISAHLAYMLGHVPDLRVLGSFSTAESALVDIPARCPDVVILDIHLPGINGIECVRQLKKLCPESQILMLTVFDDSETIFQALAAGASGYLLKRTALPQIIESIRDLHQGGSPFTSQIARKVVQYFQKPTRAPEIGLAELSPREREVLELLAQGDMYKEIADKLGVALDTIRKHVRSIYEKLHVRSRTEAVVKFLGK
jgi:DNA-binding NarL/FixJ family response regulator